jgi:hypothetical protein
MIAIARYFTMAYEGGIEKYISLKVALLFSEPVRKPDLTRAAPRSSQQAPSITITSGHFLSR